MSVIYLLLPLALLVAAGFVAAFLWAVHKGQYDDLETPPYRAIFDEEPSASHDKRPADGQDAP